jgi:cytoskeletal protein RodZ
VHYDVTSGRANAKHRIKTVAISTLVILALIVVAGAAYTWYNGQQPAAEAHVATSTEPQAKQIQAKIPSKNTQESAAVELLTSPVAPGENSMITVKTNAGSTCKIAVVYNNVPETDSGLTPKKADNFGTVSWAWTVPKGTPLGSWPITVTCQFYDKSAVVSQDLRVQATSTAN